MSILGEIFNFGARGTSSGFMDFFGFAGPDGKSIATPKSSLTLSAFFNGVDQLSTDIAKLPKGVYRKTGDSRERIEHPANYLMEVAPNELMTAFDFWRVVVIKMILKGETIVKIHRNQAGEEEFFEILENNEEVDVIKKNMKLYYVYKDEVLLSADVLHFKNFTLDGIRGVSVIKYAAHDLGIQLDSKKYSADVYTNRGLGYGVIESDSEVKDDNKKKLAEGFKARMSEKGPIKVAVLDFGLKYKSISITPAEAQFIESGRFGIEDIARWLNMPLHKLKSLVDSNFSTLEQQNTQYVVDCLMGWAKKIESELKRKLFPKDHPFEDYVKFNEKGMLRGDSRSQADFYTKMIYAGVFTPNEVRRLEDMNPIEGLDEPFKPVNMELLAHAIKMNKKEEQADE